MSDPTNLHRQWLSLSIYNFERHKLENNFPKYSEKIWAKAIIENDSSKFISAQNIETKKEALDSRKLKRVMSLNDLRNLRRQMKTSRALAQKRVAFKQSILWEAKRMDLNLPPKHLSSFTALKNGHWLSRSVVSITAAGAGLQAYDLYRALRREGQAKNQFMAFGSGSARELGAVIGSVTASLVGAALGSILGGRKGVMPFPKLGRVYKPSYISLYILSHPPWKGMKYGLREVYMPSGNFFAMLGSAAGSAVGQFMGDHAGGRIYDLSQPVQRHTP